MEIYSEQIPRSLPRGQASEQKSIFSLCSLRFAAGNIKKLLRFLLLLTAFLLLQIPAYSSANDILFVTLDGVVNPVMADYLDDVLKEASQKQGEAAMPPGTNIGSAHPVSMGGKMDETMSKKVENDAVAYIKGIAAKRGRNAEWAEKAVRESVNVTAEEALKLGVVDMLASTKEELFTKLDGMKVEPPSGTVTLATKGAAVVDKEMSLRYRILNAISNPNVAYILMIIGVAGIYFELAHPGAIFPGGIRAA